MYGDIIIIIYYYYSYYYSYHRKITKGDLLRAIYKITKELLYQLSNSYSMYTDEIKLKIRTNYKVCTKRSQ